MPDYQVKFSIHLIPFLKPEGWTNPVFHDIYIAAEDFIELKNSVDNYFMNIIKLHGVIIHKETDKPMADNIETMDLRRFIPMGTISYIEQKTTKLTTKIPNVLDEGLFIQ